MKNQSLKRLTAYVSIRSVGKTSVFAEDANIRRDTVQEFCSTPKDKHLACGKLQDMGFEIERVGALSVRVSGPAALFRNKMGVQFARSTAGVAPMYAPTEATVEKLMEPLVPEIEGIAFPQPIELHGGPPRRGPSATAPALGYHHLNVPGDVVRLLGAKPVHAEGFKGQSVRAAMIDSGFQWSHPYFTSKNYNVKVSLPLDSDADASGHGTGESANLLAVALRVRLHGLAMDDIIEAFQICRDDLGVQIISNSWGSRFPTDGPNATWDPYWSLVEAEIALCAQQGIIVLFSAGNGGMSFTASMPETISAGGVYVDARGDMQASNYASSFDSVWWPDEHVPEVCGLVGMQPKAIYIALPIPQSCDIDRRYGGRSFPNRDETRRNDGWGVFSGTSAACPQVAGVVALILSKHPAADLDEVRQRLQDATDVTQGQSAMGDSAGPGYDAATGYGLVDAEQACR